MKIDLDSISIFYIILSILIVALSVLGRKRKKPVPRIPQQEGYREEYGEPDDTATLQKPLQTVTDPFDKLEQLFGFSNEIESFEDESLDETYDEEEQLEDEEKSVTTPDQESLVEEQQDLDISVSEEDEEFEKDWVQLFREPDEIKKAIIYSEILHRKEY